MRRLPPQDIDKNLSDLIDLVPHLVDDLLSSIDQPLKVAKDPKKNKDYLLCDYNRDGDSYRSPWSNEFFPPIEDGNAPSDRMRKLEEQANDAFDVYREQYFDGGISSCYFWEEDHGGFSGAILIKKTGDLKNKFRSSWDSIHVIEVHEKGAGRNAHYKLISTVMLWLQNTRSGSGQMDLGGSLSRQVEKDLPVTNDMFSHIVNIGGMVEKMENNIRGVLETVYFGRTLTVLNDVRSLVDLESKKQHDKLSQGIANAIKNKDRTSTN